MSDLHDLAPPLLVELGDRQAQQLAFGHRIETEIGFADGALDGANLRLVPDLHRDQPRLRYVHGGELGERHLAAIGIHHDGIEKMRRSAAGTKAAELLLQHLQGAVHAPVDFLQIEVRHEALPPRLVLTEPNKALISSTARNALRQSWSKH